MTDVARLAGVSHQTVSRVLHDNPHVRPETRERVLAAVLELDYQPNSMARALATGRSRTLGVVSFDTTLFGPASTLLGIERAAHDEGYFVSIISLRSLDRVSVLSAIERLRAQGVDGIVVIAPLSSAAEALVDLPANPPVVAAEAGPDDAVPVVAVEQFAGAATATQHLLDRGHRTVCHIAGPAGWPEASERTAGWRSVLEAVGAEVRPPLRGDWSPRSGYELGRQMTGWSDVTAVFVANDQMALGVLRALHEAQREIPHEVSVVGFDDVPEAAFFSPPLTTVRQDFNEVGRRSLHRLLQQMGGDPPAPSRITVATKLVVRKSTAAPPR